MQNITLSATEEVLMMTADNRAMAVMPRPDGEDHILELLPRVRYRVKTQPCLPALFFDTGVILVPEPGGTYAIAMNLSDRMATIRCSSAGAAVTPPLDRRRKWRDD